MASEKVNEEFTSVRKIRNYWSSLRPRLDYRTNRLCSMPQTIDPKNWTPITPEEQRAHRERQAIRGRLRREYWTKAYHPEHWQHFYVGTTDKALVRYGRLKTVWHMKEVVTTSGTMPLKALLFAAILPLVFATGCYHYHKPTTPSIFEVFDL